MSGMMRNPTVSVQGIMDPSSYPMPKPPNVTIDTGDGRTQTVHLNRCKIHQFQGGSPIPLAVNDFTGSHLAKGPLIESENMDRHRFSDEFETRDRNSPQPIASQQEPGTTLSGRIVQKPLLYRETLLKLLKEIFGRNLNTTIAGAYRCVPCNRGRMEESLMRQ